MGIAGKLLFFQPDPTSVTTIQDNNVVGSLRWCVDNAPYGSTIRFAQGLGGIIELTGGDLTFAGGKRLTIAGPGANQLPISGGNINAHIHVSKGATVALSGMSFKNSETIINAFLINEGTLTVTNSIISNNRTGAGATAFGGGIYNSGTLTVTDSTFSNNSSVGDQNGEGGGILSLGKDASAIIRFSTIYGNTSNTGGGIWVDQTGSSHMMISSSIIAANNAPDGPEISGAVISGGYNLIQDDVAATVLNTSTDKHVALADLNLDTTLGNNSGPTQTLKLLRGSKAIDAVPLQACSITTDQLGDPRPDGSENACDVGAYESSYQD